MEYLKYLNKVFISWPRCHPLIRWGREGGRLHHVLVILCFVVTAEVTMGLGLNPNPRWYHLCLRKAKSLDTAVLFVFGLNSKASALPKGTSVCSPLTNPSFPTAPDIMTSAFVPRVFLRIHNSLGLCASIAAVEKYVILHNTLFWSQYLIQKRFSDYCISSSVAVSYSRKPQEISVTMCRSLTSRSCLSTW